MNVLRNYITLGHFMKKYFLILIFSAFVIGVAAQEKNPAAKDTTDHAVDYKKDCLMMKEGRMFMTKDGKTIDMVGDVTLNDGSVVNQKGVVKMKDGSTKLMHNGDCVDMNGTWEKTPRDLKN
jgi:hypothetical protein